MAKLIIFTIVTFALLIVSWPSLTAGKRYSFFRLCAFESALVLILIQTSVWFDDPLAIHQLVSWVLFLISAGLALSGYLTLRKHGRPSAGIETTTSLVTGGIYRHIRHPLYASLLYFALGVFAKAPSMLVGAIALVSSTFVWAAGKAEEAENLSRFGSEYSFYMRSTKMFIPYLF